MELSIHYVKKIILGKTKKFTIESTGRIYYYRKIVIVMKRDESIVDSFELSLFSDKPEYLKQTKFVGGI